MTRYGRISEVNASTGKARVKFLDDATVSHELPILVTNSASNKYSHSFAINELVAVAMVTNEDGIILGAIYGGSNTPTGASANKAKVVFSDSAIVEYDYGSSQLDITIGTTEIKASTAGVAIKVGAESIKTLLTELLTALQVQTHNVTAVGAPTGPPINIASYTTLQTKVNTFFTE